MASNAPTPERSAFWHGKWLANCEGFRVEAPDGRIGHVTGIRFGPSSEPQLLEVRAGLLGRRLLLIPVGQVHEIVPEEKRILLSGPPQLADDR